MHVVPKEGRAGGNAQRWPASH